MKALIFAILSLAVGSCRISPEPSGAAVAEPSSISRAELEIARIAGNSKIARHHWKARGVAPIGYTKGMALVYARTYCRLRQGDRYARAMARAAGSDPAKDALAKYADEFRRLRMRNDQAGADTLRHWFALLLGMGMWESSGKWWEGVDVLYARSPDGTEAGLFQSSWDSKGFHPLLMPLFNSYRNRPSGLLEVFKEGVSEKVPRQAGAGEAAEFQRLSKTCPSFAVEYAALAVRAQCKDWQPIRDKDAELHPDADALFKSVEKAVDSMAACGSIDW